MMHTYSRGLAIALVAAVATMALGGCGVKHERELDILKGKNRALMSQKSTLQGKLSAAAVANRDLQDQLKGLQTQANAKIKELQDKLAKAGGAGGTTGIRVAGGEVLVYNRTLGGDVLFSAGQATLTAAGKKALAAVVAELKAKHPGRLVRVYGHTDSDPIVKSRKLWQDNLDLSANRAMAVSRHLAAKGIKAGLIETVAMGSASPVASNSTKAGKARNRRVEIVVIKK